MRYLLSSIALVAPCFWLPRIEAGDLASHVYNAWLAQLIARGEAPGLSLHPQWTNVLFDLILSALWGLGPAPAHKIAVALAVLIFIWGAFAFATAVNRRQPWFLLPILGVLAYGWVFHSGFFNFYLSLGLCFWALALAWRPSRARVAGAVAILALALVAHALPVFWAIGSITYQRLARAVRPRYRGGLMLGMLALIVALRCVLEWRVPTQWYPLQMALITGTDQVWVYGTKYHLLQPVLLLICGLLLMRILARGWRRLALSIPLQITVATMLAVAILPSRILPPGYQHALGYIAERMSLAVAICGSVVLAQARARRFETGAIAAVAVVFFAFLFVDERPLNRMEARIEQALASAPEGARVVNGISATLGRTDPLAHMIDRACIGRCFSYANYEASTGQFRVRAKPGNPVVVSDYDDSWALQMGRYTVKTRDMPLYVVVPAADGEGFVVRALAATEPVELARARVE